VRTHRDGINFLHTLPTEPGFDRVLGEHITRNRKA
jgi:hypothetical protein